jgi:hypothetical protein
MCLMLMTREQCGAMTVRCCVATEIRLHAPRVIDWPRQPVRFLRLPGHWIGKTALTWPVPELPKYSVTISTLPR